MGTMKTRPIKELLQLVLYKLKAKKGYPYFLCYIIDDLFDYEKIDDAEYEKLLKYLDENRPNTKRANYNDPIGDNPFWDGTDKQSRIEYLEKHINKLHIFQNLYRDLTGKELNITINKVH